MGEAGLFDVTLHHFVSSLVAQLLVQATLIKWRAS